MNLLIVDMEWLFSSNDGVLHKLKHSNTCHPDDRPLLTSFSQGLVTATIKCLIALSETEDTLRLKF